jgi:hypothetical protein
MQIQLFAIAKRSTRKPGRSKKKKRRVVVDKPLEEKIQLHLTPFAVG